MCVNIVLNYSCEIYVFNTRRIGHWPHNDICDAIVVAWGVEVRRWRKHR